MRAPTYTLAKGIRALRQALGKTQEGIAHALGVSKATYQFWEAGKHIPSGKGLLRLQALCPNAALRRMLSAESHLENLNPVATAQSKNKRQAARARSRQDAERSIEILYDLATRGSPGAESELRRSARRLARRARHWSQARRKRKSP